MRMRIRHEKAKSLCMYMWGKRGHICKPNSVYTAYDDDDDDDSTSSIGTKGQGSRKSLDRQMMMKIHVRQRRNKGDWNYLV